MGHLCVDYVLRWPPWTPCNSLIHEVLVRTQWVGKINPRATLKNTIHEVLVRTQGVRKIKCLIILDTQTWSSENSTSKDINHISVAFALRRTLCQIFTFTKQAKPIKFKQSKQDLKRRPWIYSILIEVASSTTNGECAACMIEVKV
jgi:hypothetical protein